MHIQELALNSPLLMEGLVSAAALAVSIWAGLALASFADRLHGRAARMPRR
jgi:hypothetical protein